MRGRLARLGLILVLLATSLSVAMGPSGVAAAPPSGSVFAWGDGNDGQIGNGLDLDRAVADKVAGIGKVIAVAGGGYHSLALAADGTVWAWGGNWGGQLGDGTTIDRQVPVRVVSPDGTGLLSNIKAIAAGENVSVALTNDGYVYTWGENGDGQLGIGYSYGPDFCQEVGAPCSKVPVPVVSPNSNQEYLRSNLLVTDRLSDIQAIDAGDDQVLALTNDGHVYAWGQNDSGVLGTGSPSGPETCYYGDDCSTVPVMVVGPDGTGSLGGIRQVSIGGDFALALTTGGQVYSWGDNGHGQLGRSLGEINQDDFCSADDYYNSPCSTVPGLVVGLEGGEEEFLGGIQAIAAGFFHSLALADDGHVYAWGSNEHGALGVGYTDGPDVCYTGYYNYEGVYYPDYSFECSQEPVPVVSPSGEDDTALHDIAAIAAGGGNSLALTTRGALYSWGLNPDGQLGVGSFFGPEYCDGDDFETSDDCSTTPVPVIATNGGAPLRNVIGMAVGEWHSLAIVNPVLGQCGAAFTDVPEQFSSKVSDPTATCFAIETLAAHGIIRGYGDQTFGPNKAVERDEVAAFIVRALNWQDWPTGPETFSDLNPSNPQHRSALILANACDEETGKCVAQGYENGRFGPDDYVSYAQVITFITRAFMFDETYAWVPQEEGNLPYGGIPAVHANDVRTYLHYAGPIADVPDNWNAAAPRAWVAQVLFQAWQTVP